VAERNGTPLLVKDLAQVSVGAVPRQGIVGQDEDDEAVTGIVLMRKGENPSEVLTALKEKVAALNRSVLPKGVQVVSFYDRTWLIHTTLKTVFTNLLEGALLVTCVLYLFLGNVRAAGIVAVWCLYPWARHGQPGCRDATASAGRSGSASRLLYYLGRRV
jgi:cobalt-zinc-cadmium resistance protein CzcA